jgi:periplasmic copper chaperone A
LPNSLAGCRALLSLAIAIAPTVHAHVTIDPPLDDGHGGGITEVVSEVAWSGGPLEDAHFDEFGLTMRLPDRPNATLYFPVVQECGKGGIHRWIEIPEAGKAAGDYREPAPAVLLLPPK